MSKSSRLTLFLPGKGGISPYMSVTWPSLVRIGLSFDIGWYKMWTICAQLIIIQLHRLQVAHQQWLIMGRSQTTLTRFWVFWPPSPLCWHFLLYERLQNFWKFSFPYFVHFFNTTSKIYAHHVSCYKNNTSWCVLKD